MNKKINESIRKDPNQEFQRSLARMKNAVLGGNSNQAQRLRGSMSAAAAGMDYQTGNRDKNLISTPSSQDVKYGSSDELIGRTGTGIALKKKIMDSVRNKLNKKLFESNKALEQMVEPITYETDDLDPNLLTRKPETYWDTSDPNLNLTFAGRPDAFSDLLSWLSELLWGSVGIFDLTPEQMNYAFNNYNNWIQQMGNFITNIPIGGIGWIQTPDDGWFAVSHDGENGWTIVSYYTSWPGFLGHPFDVSTHGNVLMNPLWLYLYTVNGIRR